MGTHSIEGALVGVASGPARGCSRGTMRTSRGGGDAVHPDIAHIQVTCIHC